MGTGSEWVDGNVLNADDLLDSIVEYRWNTALTSPVPGTIISGVIGHSSTKLSVMLTSGAIWQLSGTTWTNRSSPCDTTSFIVRARNDATIGFACENSATSETAYTADSGDTWTTKTSATWGGDVNDVDMPSSALIVMVGDDGGGGNHIIFSTDQGGSWVDATTQPSAAIYSVSMFSATVGYAIDNAGNIWKTTNGAVDWVDTTHNVNGTARVSSKIYAVSATACIILTEARLDVYDNTGGTVTAKFGYYGYSGGICETTSGAIYVQAFKDTSLQVAIYRTLDNGTNWQQVEFGLTQLGTDVDHGKFGISELGTTDAIVTCKGSERLAILYNGD